MRLANFAIFFACGEDMARNKQSPISINTLVYRVLKNDESRLISIHINIGFQSYPAMTMAKMWRARGEKKGGVFSTPPKEIPPFKAIPVRPDGTGLHRPASRC